MGTRADFYVGRGPQAEWLGSIAWDGYPDGIRDVTTLLGATTEEGFRTILADFAATRDDWTAPERGWPWPWKDSRTTDYAYAFDGGLVWASCFGGEWFEADKEEPDDANEKKVAVFPNMASRKNVRLDKGSGMIFLGGA